MSHKTLLSFAQKRVQYVDLLAPKSGDAARRTQLEADCMQGIMQAIKGCKWVPPETAIELKTILEGSMDTACVDSIMNVCNTKVDLALGEKGPATKEKGGQALMTLDSWLTDQQWQAFSNQGFGVLQKLSLMAGVFAAIGLHHADEHTKALGTSIACQSDGFDRDTLYTRLGEFKAVLATTLKASTCICGPLKFPQTPDAMKEMYLQLYTQAFPDANHPPVPSKWNLEFKHIIVANAPCRNTRTGVAKYKEISAQLLNHVPATTIANPPRNSSAGMLEIPALQLSRSAFVPPQERLALPPIPQVAAGSTLALQELPPPGQRALVQLAKHADHDLLKRCQTQVDENPSQLVTHGLEPAPATMPASKPAASEPSQLGWKTPSSMSLTASGGFAVTNEAAAAAEPQKRSMAEITEAIRARQRYGDGSSDPWDPADGNVATAAGPKAGAAPLVAGGPAGVVAGVPPLANGPTQNAGKVAMQPHLPVQQPQRKRQRVDKKPAAACSGVQAPPPCPSKNTAGPVDYMSGRIYCSPSKNCFRVIRKFPEYGTESKVGWGSLGKPDPTTWAAALKAIRDYAR